VGKIRFPQLRIIGCPVTHRDLPTVQLDEALGQGKPQPGALGLPAAVLAELLELLESPSPLLGAPFSFLV
jgi:hypothetical protein